MGWFCVIPDFRPWGYAYAPRALAGTRINWSRWGGLKSGRALGRYRGRAALAILFTNLIDNAVRYTTAGGRVEIRVAAKVTSFGTESLLPHSYQQAHDPFLADWHRHCTVLTMLLRVLLVGSNPDLEDAVEASLGQRADIELVRATGGVALVEAVAAAAPDVIIVDLVRPDWDGLDAIRHVAREQPRPIVMFVGADDPAFMEAAIAAGVSSYNVVGTARPDVKPIVRSAVAVFRRYRQVEEELAAAQASIAEGTVIDKAKARLIRQRHLSEPEAYRLLRRRAMNEGRRIADIARVILETGG